MVSRDEELKLPPGGLEREAWRVVEKCFSRLAGPLFCFVF